MNWRPNIRSGVVIACSAAALWGCGGDDPDLTRVTTDRGAVQGVASTDGYRYLGIPYAQAPTGALRWKAPAAAAAWTGLRDASAFGSNCPQTGPVFGTRSLDEDCLYLNVYRPKGQGPFPVFVWIHGGALVDGQGDDYDPERIVAQGMVAVTINYRLGALGFLSHPALSAEAGAKGSGNYGFMDQQLALRWVRSNIAGFGGDARNVTIAGESAGGLSVNSHLVSPLSAGLFDKAISMSGGYVRDNLTLAQAEAVGTAFATAAGCGNQSAECLRELSVTQILALPNNRGLGVQGWAPVTENNVFDTSIRLAFAQGRFQHVPVMTGSNGNEFSLISALLFDLMPPPAGLGPVTASTYPAALAAAASATFQPSSVAPADAESAYLGITDLVDRVDAIGTDRVFACPGYELGRALAGYTSVYAYEFDDADAPQYLLPPLRAKWGAFHAAELYYLMKTRSVPGATPAALTADQARLSAEMVAAWAQFAKTGNPNPVGAADWPRLSGAGGSYWSWRPGQSMPSADFAARHKCSLWAGD